MLFGGRVHTQFTKCSMPLKSCDDFSSLLGVVNTIQ